MPNTKKKTLTRGQAKKQTIPNLPLNKLTKPELLDKLESANELIEKQKQLLQELIEDNLRSQGVYVAK